MLASKKNDYYFGKQYFLETSDSGRILQIKKKMPLVKKYKIAGKAVLINCYAMRLYLIIAC